MFPWRDLRVVPLTSWDMRAWTRDRTFCLYWSIFDRVSDWSRRSARMAVVLSSSMGLRSNWTRLAGMSLVPFSNSFLVGWSWLRLCTSLINPTMVSMISSLVIWLWTWSSKCVNTYGKRVSLTKAMEVVVPSMSNSKCLASRGRRGMVVGVASRKSIWLSEEAAPLNAGAAVVAATSSFFSSACIVSSSPSRPTPLSFPSFLSSSSL
mmetsp:Transcript_3607/g.7264  ORF Transcript_3607/g.7264 Transcript_3607/m.7264 type:complete len:207 (+) Transcript_3607:797-1417(+)